MIKPSQLQNIHFKSSINKFGFVCMINYLITLENFEEVLKCLTYKILKLINMNPNSKVYRVRFAEQKIPSAHSQIHKGKYYHSIFQIAEKRLMVLGGRPGTNKDYWDDKTFVFQYEGKDRGCKYIGNYSDIIPANRRRTDFLKYIF